MKTDKLIKILDTLEVEIKNLRFELVNNNIVTTTNNNWGKTKRRSLLANHKIVLDYFKSKPNKPIYRHDIQSATKLDAIDLYYSLNFLQNKNIGVTNEWGGKWMFTQPVVSATKNVKVKSELKTKPAFKELSARVKSNEDLILGLIKKGSCRFTDIKNNGRLGSPTVSNNLKKLLANGKIKKVDNLYKAV